MKNDPSFRKGIIFALAGFSIWGFLPLYWSLLHAITPMHILALRILLSLVLLGSILALNKNFLWLTVFKDVKKGGMIILASLVLCVNWGVYLWAVTQGRNIEASLGYYMNPLVSIVLGLIFFREKLSALQWTAFGCACLGVLILTLLSGALPWISVTLAVCFGLYGLIKKKVKLSSLESLTAETLAAVPLGVILLFLRIETAASLPRLCLDWHNASYIAQLGAPVLIPLVFIGAISSLPLYCFGQGAKLLPLSTLGFTQFLAPTIQFFLGVFFFKEYFPIHYVAAFTFIWLAAILYVVSLRRLASR